MSEKRKKKGRRQKKNKRRRCRRKNRMKKKKKELEKSTVPSNVAACKYLTDVRIYVRGSVCLVRALLTSKLSTNKFRESASVSPGGRRPFVTSSWNPRMKNKLGRLHRPPRVVQLRYDWYVTLKSTLKEDDWQDWRIPFTHSTLNVLACTYSGYLELVSRTYYTERKDSQSRWNYSHFWRQTILFNEVVVVVCVC